MMDEILKGDSRAALLEFCEDCLANCRAEARSLLGRLPSADPKIVLSDDPQTDPETRVLSLKDVRKWAENMRHCPSSEDGFPEDLCDALRRFYGESHRDFVPEESRRHPSQCGKSVVSAKLFRAKNDYDFPFPDSTLGEYDASAKTITIYYRRHASFARRIEKRAKAGKGKQKDLIWLFLSDVFGTICHEYCHHLHHDLAGNERLFKSHSWKKKAICESLADYFFYACLTDPCLWDPYKLAETNRKAAERRRELWERYYGSPWPCAYALLIAEHPDRDERFKEVFDKSLSDWNEAWALLTEGENIKSFADIKKIIDKTSLGQKRDLFFCEFSSPKTSSAGSSRSRIPSNAFSVMASPSIVETLKPKDVSSEILEGRYSLGAPYTLLYLYDYRKDAESRRFIELYGGKIHNKVSAKVTVLTFFDRATAGNWKNVQCRDQIVCQDEIEPSACERMVSSMEEKFGVASLPSLVLIKKEGSYSAPISFSNLDAEGIYDGFVDVLQKIDDNCEEDFGELSKIIARGGLSLKKGAWECLEDEWWTYRFVSYHQKRKRMSQLDLALDIGISERMLRNKLLYGDFFSREECLKLGVVFGLCRKDLNDLLVRNNNAPLGDSSLDSAVLGAIAKGMTIYTVQQDSYLKGKLFPSRKRYVRKKKE